MTFEIIALSLMAIAVVVLIWSVKRDRRYYGADSTTFAKKECRDALAYVARSVDELEAANGWTLDDLLTLVEIALVRGKRVKEETKE